MIKYKKKLTQIHWNTFGNAWEYVPKSSSPQPKSDQTNLLWSIGGAPFTNDTSTLSDVTSGLCLTSQTHVLTSGVAIDLALAKNQSMTPDGLRVIFYCFLSLKDAYVALVRFLYVILFLSLDFLPIMLFVYPLRHYEPLEKALGVNLDKMTCYLLPIVSIFMLLFVIVIEFQLK